MRTAGHTYDDIAAKLSTTSDAIRSCWRRYQYLGVTSDDAVNTKSIKQIALTKRNNSMTAKENRALLQEHLTVQDILEQIKEMTGSLNKKKSPKAPAKAKGRTAMTMEALISDVHIGKKTDTFNLAVCRARLRHFTEVFLGEVERNNKIYNVERLILSFLGDNIEHSNMHGLESMVGCEFSNPEQIKWAIELFLTEIILPISALGIPVDIIGIAGNHDREGEKRTYNNPGKNSFAWIIYETLRLITAQLGLSHVSWTIPEGVYLVLNIYGNNFLYEHGDNVRGNNYPTINTHLSNRSTQIGEILHGIRLGHYHRYTHYDNGRVIINSSVCGPDSYSDVLGYTSHAGQVINYYVKTVNRKSSFFRSFLVQL